ncbi:TIGR00375 family protein [Methanohalophilus halophilus]|uniref:TIGR00375 family protein n=1 Tax=Methanohalophilus halophilus TaxID=2177 RepID=A0A1L3Q245_9EURY|nr:TIGR00375 family protein [Methanohalophilus halophilus]APH38939.1 TIGR00375 family protein [Methanohalophilus halophilus]RNI07435.1 TIGR00375 family protein [Methanohalophilus halophilus]SDW65839.1 TIGR00375 family protein [Methanohalophilus halophilus]
MLINADLHLHSKYSMACSNKMELPVMAREAAKKGINLVATGDCIHPKWLSEIREYAQDDGTVGIDNTSFILTTEIEDKNRVHHLLLVPSISKAEELAEKVAGHGDLTVDGRPTLKLDGGQIAEIATDVGALIGPCHAFTPWTAMYAYHDSLESCYGDMADSIAFLELGLSADSDYADRIEELQDLTFLSNSDAHSPWSNKLAREFNRLEVPEVSFEGVKKAIQRKEGYGCVLNVGFFPQEGKYNESACIKCYRHYTMEEAINLDWNCRVCGGQIKKGVADRVNELANYDTPEHPSHRPDYLHLIPLAEIIMMALDHASINTKGVSNAWKALVEHFGSETAVLLEADISQLDFVDPRIVRSIEAFRNEDVILHPGGGGKYGWIELPDNLKANKKSSSQKADPDDPNLAAKQQKSLFDF